MHLYVTEQGARLSKSGAHLVVSKAGEPLNETLLQSVESVLLFGSVQSSSEALKALMDVGADVSFFTRDGRLKGKVVANSSNNVGLRLCQYDVFRNKVASVEIVRNIVLRKLENGLKVLDLYNANEHNPFKFENRLEVLKNIERVRLYEGSDKNVLRGYEGYGAKLYFENFAKCLMHGVPFNGREYHPCKDPVNALLSLGYSLVASSLQSLIESYGMDPAIGFLHEPSYGRVSLAYDLLEEFRHPFVDRLVLKVLNRKLIGVDDFEFRDGEGAPGQLFLKPTAMRAFIRSYEEFCDSANRACKDDCEISWRGVLRQRVEAFRRMLLEGANEPLVWSPLLEAA